jgi:hypothetical protein
MPESRHSIRDIWGARTPFRGEDLWPQGVDCNIAEEPERWVPSACVLVRGAKANPVEGEHTLFGFLTTDANEIVKSVHAKAMPVILMTPEEMDAWMTAPTAEALSLQRPLPDETLRIVAQGRRRIPPLEGIDE